MLPAYDVIYFVRERCGIFMDQAVRTSESCTPSYLGAEAWADFQDRFATNNRAFTLAIRRMCSSSRKWLKLGCLCFGQPRFSFTLNQFGHAALGLGGCVKPHYVFWRAATGNQIDQFHINGFARLHSGRLFEHSAKPKPAVRGDPPPRPVAVRTCYSIIDSSKSIHRYTPKRSHPAVLPS